MKKQRKNRMKAVITGISMLLVLLMMGSSFSVPAYANDSQAVGEEQESTEIAKEEPAKEAAPEDTIQKSEWEAFQPKITNLPKKLKATKEKTLKTNAPKGVKVTWKTFKNDYASLSKKGVLKGKRVGKVTVTAVFSAVVNGKAVQKKLKSAKIKIAGKKIIYLDPGHQEKANLGLEPTGPGSSGRNIKVSGGCVGVATKIPEYKFTLTLAKKLEKALLKKGYDVVMSRTKNDVNISNRERALKANKSKADISIRIHADSYTDSSVRGASVLYPSTSNRYISKSQAKKSKKLAQKLLNAYCKATGLRNRGLFVRNDLVGINWSKMPNVLIECGFFSNPAEDRFMNKAKNQDKMVKGMVKAVDSYFGY